MIMSEGDNPGGASIHQSNPAGARKKKFSKIFIQILLSFKMGIRQKKDFCIQNIFFGSKIFF